LKKIQRTGQGSPDITWFHPLLALHLAQWLDAGFAVQMTIWCARFISGDASLIQDVTRRVDEVHGTRSIITHTMMDRKEHESKLAEAHATAAQWQSQVLQLQREIKEVVVQQKQAALSMQEATLKMQDAAVQAENERIKHEQDQLYWDDKKSQLEIKIRTLGADPDEDVRVLQLSRKRKLAEIKHTLDVAGDMETKMLQEGDAESMPTRYIALRGVTETSSGATYKAIRELNKAVFYAIGENLARYVNDHGTSRRRLLRILERILDEDIQDNGTKTIRSNIAIFTLLCANIKRVHELPYATHVTLRDMYKYCQDYNAWVVRKELSERYRLIQQADLACLLGYQGYKIPRLPRYDHCDIRNYFQSK